MAAAEAEDLRARLVLEFISIASRYNAEGWIEFSLWETVEGRRDKPVPFLAALNDEEMDVLRLLRDEVKVWVFWKEADKQWFAVPIENWRKHASTRTALDIVRSLER